MQDIIRARVRSSDKGNTTALSLCVRRLKWFCSSCSLETWHENTDLAALSPEPSFDPQGHGKPGEEGDHLARTWPLGSPSPSRLECRWGQVSALRPESLQPLSSSLLFVLTCSATDTQGREKGRVWAERESKSASQQGRVGPASAWPTQGNQGKLISLLMKTLPGAQKSERTAHRSWLRFLLLGMLCSLRVGIGGLCCTRASWNGFCGLRRICYPYTILIYTDARGCPGRIRHRPAGAPLRHLRLDLIVFWVAHEFLRNLGGLVWEGCPGSLRSRREWG